MAQRDRAWLSGEIGELYTLTLSAASVVSSPALLPGWYAVEADGGDAWIASGVSAVALVPTVDGSKARRVRDGGGGYVYLSPDLAARYIGAKRTGSTTVTVLIQRVG